MAIEEKPSRNEDEYFARLDAELMKERRARLDDERLKQERCPTTTNAPSAAAICANRGTITSRWTNASSAAGSGSTRVSLEMIEEFDKRGSGFMSSLFRQRR